MLTQDCSGNARLLLLLFIYYYLLFIYLFYATLFGLRYAFRLHVIDARCFLIARHRCFMLFDWTLSIFLCFKIRNEKEMLKYIIINYVVLLLGMFMECTILNLKNVALFSSALVCCLFVNFLNVFIYFILFFV